MEILIGDVREKLRGLAAGSVQTVVTSPPYYGLRSYLPEDNKDKGKEIGTEKTPEQYVENMVEVFREVWRVLADDGTLWLNLGDSYWGGKGKSAQAWSTKNQKRKTLQKHYHQISGKGETRPTDGRHEIIKPKDLIGIPWMVAFALRADGWYLRQDIIWNKPNPMTESMTDRCTKAHEYIFLFSKNKKYYYDHEAIKTPSKDPGDNRGARKHKKRFPTDKVSGIRGPGVYPMANKRSVWTVPTVPYKESHFATYPPALIEPCILAGSKPGDTVLDPFGGSGTTAQVALENGRNCILIDLDERNVELINKRLGLFGVL